MLLRWIHSLSNASLRSTDTLLGSLSLSLSVLPLGDDYQTLCIRKCSWPWIGTKMPKQSMHAQGTSRMKLFLANWIQSGNGQMDNGLWSMAGRVSKMITRRSMIHDPLSLLARNWGLSLLSSPFTTRIAPLERAQFPHLQIPVSRCSADTSHGSGDSQDTAAGCRACLSMFGATLSRES